jgi:hypothetical protein
MDEGTLKTPILTGRFCLGWCSNFVGFESGQKQSVQFLQNMVYNTQSHTGCIYCTFTLGRGGEGKLDGRGATVHKYIFFVHGATVHELGRKYQT